MTSHEKIRYAKSNRFSKFFYYVVIRGNEKWEGFVFERIFLKIKFVVCANFICDYDKARSKQ